MKIQNLAVIFVIIILPISMIVTAYTRNQVQTLSLQTAYDTKLNNATYDALKAFQLNTINSDTSDLANSKLRDVEASANTFFNSIASNFNMVGYNKDVLSEYVPALVYTMYDGYYIYSPFNNKLDNANSNQIIDSYGNIEEKTDAEILSEGNPAATFKEKQRLTGMKPYIHYSCRYKTANTDVVITYSLDNYITIEGRVNGNWEYRYGYLLDNINIGSNVTYRGINIRSDLPKEYVNEAISYPYIRLNGVKYYIDQASNNKCFTVTNEIAYPQGRLDVGQATENSTAIAYYKEADNFTKWVRNNLGNLKSNDAVDEQGNKINATRWCRRNQFLFYLCTRNGKKHRRYQL